MTHSESRLGAVREALARLPPGTLQQAADNSPEPLASLLRALAQPDADLPTLLDAATQDPRVSATQVDQVIVDALLELERIGLGLETIGEAAGRLEQANELLLQSAGQWVDELQAEDAELATILGRALEATAQLSQTLQGVSRVATQGPALVDALSALLEGARGGAIQPAALAQIKARMAGLEATVQGITPSEAQLDTLLAVIEDLRDLAVARGLPVAAILAAYAAAVREARGQEDLIEDWRQAFALAARNRDIPLARATGQRAQLLAIEQERFDLASAVSGVLGELAEEIGDLRAEVLAKLERILLESRQTQDPKAASAEVEALLPRVASAPPALRARVLLTLAQARQQAGDLEGARTACRKVMKLAPDAQAFPRELGRAALLLATLQADHQPSQARKNLGLALDVARRTQDWQLFAQATLQSLDPTTAPGLLAEARRMAGADWPAFLALLEKRYGRATVQGWQQA